MKEQMKEGKNKPYSKLKKGLVILIVFSPILYVFFNILKWPIYNSLLDKYSKKVNATIIDERNVQGKGVITEMFTYSYEFYLNGKNYKGDSRKRGYKIGNKLEVEYLESCPSINRPSNSKTSSK